MPEILNEAIWEFFYDEQIKLDQLGIDKVKGMPQLVHYLFMGKKIRRSNQPKKILVWKIKFN
jgi:hypothetical protein